ncbi:MAG TPA: prepilin peptidase [Gaiellaceae bacterium]|nr:prepilin peptidase [Gaiellaceae bacterium]
MDLLAALLGLAAGGLAGPAVDRLAVNAGERRPLLARTPVTRRSLLVVAACALLAGACGLAFGLTAEASLSALLCLVLVAITRTDLEHRLIPDRLVLPAALVLLVGRTLADPSLEWLLAALGAGLAMFAIVFVYPRGMGMGDVKLTLLLGAGLGLPVVVALFVGFFAAFVPALLLVLRHGRAAGKLAIPLGPFLALGAVVALFAGDRVLDWYVDLGR